MDYSESFLTTSVLASDYLSLITFDNNKRGVDIDGIINSDLETATMKNDIMKVMKLLAGGATIFIHKENVCRRLCNGYLDKKRDGHPPVCERTICFKTCVYFALINNYIAYKTIYMILFKLQYLDPNLRIPCTCCNYVNTNTDPTFLEIRDHIIRYTKAFKKLRCECNQKYNLCKGYKEDYLLFNTVYDILKDVETLSGKLVSYYNLDINNLGGLTLDDFASCIHSFVINNPITNCEKIENVTVECSNSLSLLNNLVLVINYYLVNNEILKVLFNQQAYEIYQYTIKQTKNEDDIIAVIDILYDKKILTCINYINHYSRNTILDLTAREHDLSRVIHYLFIKDAVINSHNNILNDALRRGFFNSGLELFRNSSLSHKTEHINGHSIFKYVVHSNMKLELQLRYVEGLIGSGIDLTEDRPITTALDLHNSYDFLEILINDSRILNSINHTHTDYAIIKRKADALTLLFKFGARPNGDDLHHIPIITYIDSLQDDEECSTFEVLASILSFHPNLNIKDKYGYTPLHLAARNGYILTLDNLLSAGADPFIVNVSTGETALITAIEYDKFDIVNKLVLFEKNGDHLVNIENKNKLSPLMLSVLTRNPIKMIRQLEVNDALNYEYNDDFGKNILAFIIDTKEITNEIRYVLFDMLSKRMDLTKINVLDTTPLIIRAMLREHYKIVRLIITRLYEKRQIIVKGDIQSFSNGNTNDITIETLGVGNFYNMIIKYLPINYVESNNQYINSSVKNTMNIITTLSQLALASISHESVLSASSCFTSDFQRSD